LLSVFFLGPATSSVCCGSCVPTSSPKPFYPNACVPRHFTCVHTLPLTSGVPLDSLPYMSLILPILYTSAWHMSPPLPPVSSLPLVRHPEPSPFTQLTRPFLWYFHEVDIDHGEAL
jgi:hypothetical protein